MGVEMTGENPNSLSKGEIRTTRVYNLNGCGSSGLY